MEHDPYTPHITVWCAVSHRGVTGPYFFQQRSNTVTVTGVRYKTMLEKFFIPELQRRGIPLSKVWFQQDGARPHTTVAVLQFLREQFGSRVLSKSSAVNWPPRSPDLTFPDFFLWGWLKAEVYRKPVTTISSLKSRIRRTLRNVPETILAALRDNLMMRCRACLRQRGGPIEHLTLR